MVLAAGKSFNEVYTFREMLKQEDKKDFVKAMVKKLKTMRRETIGKLSSGRLCLAA